MELERPGDERKNRRDAMADDSPDSDSADGFLPTAPSPPSRPWSWGELPAPSLQRAEEDDEHGEVEPAADVEAADVEASSDPGMGSGAGDPTGGRRSREKHPSIVFACSSASALLVLFARREHY